MTEEEIITIKELLKHRAEVGLRLRKVCNELMERAIVHDSSKFSDDEFEGNLQALPEKRALKKAGHGYRSVEYKEHEKKWQWLSDKRYSRNPHHPGYHRCGINDMSLIDLVEMLCDWYAAADDIDGSIDENAEKFKIDSQLARILKNTVRDMKDLP